MLARIHVDPDMKQIERLIEYAFMQLNYNLGMMFNKIGAKKTFDINLCVWVDFLRCLDGNQDTSQRKKVNHFLAKSWIKK